MKFLVGGVISTGEKIEAIVNKAERRVLTSWDRRTSQ